MIVLVLIHSPFRMWNVPGETVERLRRAFPHHAFVHARDDVEGLRHIPAAHIAFSSQIGPELFSAATALRWIHSPAAGIGGMLHPALVESPVQLTNSRGIAADTIAEHVLAVLLASCRRLPAAFGFQAGRRWAQEELASPPGIRMLAGSTVLLIGLGAIGSAAARRLHALGVRVIGIRRRPDAPAVEGIAEVHPSERLMALLPRADAVVLAAPRTRHTRGLIGARELEAMKPGAVLVNVSRGDVIDEEAVLASLRDGRLGGAALDVFCQEPLPAASPLWSAPNLLITPHTSGSRPDYWAAAAELFAENLRRFDRGEPLLNRVDKEAGY